jgi:glutamyl-tRNA synthetase
MEPPAFAHMPLLRNERKAKISKRKSPWARLTWFREQGYLPEALVNFLALLGYPPIVEADGTEREVFTFEEFAARFEWSKVNPAGSIFNLDKLDWLNGVWIRELPVGEFASRLAALPRGRRDPVGQPVAGRVGSVAVHRGAHPDPDGQVD